MCMCTHLYDGNCLLIYFIKLGSYTLLLHLQTFIYFLFILLFPPLSVRCVRLARFENDRTISFIPPDGSFDLMTYRLSTQVCSSSYAPRMFYHSFPLPCLLLFFLPMVYKAVIDSCGRCLILFKYVSFYWHCTLISNHIWLIDKLKASNILLFKISGETSCLGGSSNWKAF